jgi:hypothetical protein
MELFQFLLKVIQVVLLVPFSRTYIFMPGKILHLPQVVFFQPPLPWKRLQKPLG